MTCFRAGLSPQLDLIDLEYKVHTAADNTEKGSRTQRVTYEVDKPLIDKLPNASGSLEILLNNNSCRVDKEIEFTETVIETIGAEPTERKVTLEGLKAAYPGYTLVVKNGGAGNRDASREIEYVNHNITALITDNSEIKLQKQAYNEEIVQDSLPEAPMNAEQLQSFKWEHRARSITVTKASGEELLNKSVSEITESDAATIVKGNKVRIHTQADSIDLKAEVQSQTKTISTDRPNLFFGVRGTFQQRRMIYRNAPDGNFSASGGYGDAAGLKELSRSEAGIGAYILGETPALANGVLGAAELGYDRSWEWYSGGDSWATNYALTDFSKVISHQFHTLHYQVGAGTNIGNRLGVRAFFGAKNVFARRSLAQENIDETQTFGNLPGSWQTKGGNTIYNGVIQGKDDPREDGIPYFITPNGINNGGYNVFVPYLEFRLYGTF